MTAGCGTGPVQVPLPDADAGTVRLCERLRARLPDRLLDQAGRSTRPESPLLAAWGSPAMALRCGVPRPAAMRPESQLVTINGVDWFPQPGDRPVTFTAVGRAAYVEVTVPAKYGVAGDALIELIPAITAALPTKPDGEL